MSTMVSELRFKEIRPSPKSDIAILSWEPTGTQLANGNTLHDTITLFPDNNAIEDGDYLVCPKHHKRVLMVFGSGWYEWATNLKAPLVCVSSVPCHMYNLEVESYGG